MFTHIIFDVSGTLWDDRRQVAEANLKVLRDLGIEHDPISGTPLDYGWWLQHTKGSAIEFFRSFGIEEADATLEHWYMDALHKMRNTYPVELFAGIREVLHQLCLEGRTLQVISSHPQSFLEEDFRQLEITGYFSSIKGHCHSKAEHIRELMNSQDLDPSRCIYVGDTIGDVLAAKQAGIYELAVTYGFHDHQDLIARQPSFIAERPHRIYEILKEHEEA